MSRVSETDVLDALQGLVAIPSVNPLLCPQEGHGEAEIAAWADRWLAERGLRSHLEEAASDRPNVVAETGPEGARTLVLCAHLDTVGTAGMTIPPFEPRIENGRLYGRGAHDMKCGAAAAMAAAAALAAHPASNPAGGRLVVALVADEEWGSLGAHHFVANHRADGCIVTEPSEGKLILAHKGFVWVELTTQGRAAHGSRWDLGTSAIAKMGRLITALERFDQEVLRRRTDPLVGPASQHAAQIEGGSGLSTYAERCMLRLERRTLPGETPEQVLDELRRVASEAGVEVEIRELLARPPLRCDPGSAIVAAMRGAITEVAGEPAEETGVAYWMDAAIFAEAGIPTVDYGPTGAGAHAAVEWVDLASVVRCARVLENAARRFFAGV